MMQGGAQFGGGYQRNLAVVTGSKRSVARRWKMP